MTRLPHNPADRAATLIRAEVMYRLYAHRVVGYCTRCDRRTLAGHRRLSPTHRRGAAAAGRVQAWAQTDEGQTALAAMVERMRDEQEAE